MKKNNKAFTLIEIMIAVGVLAILSGVTLSVLNGPAMQGKARDSQRIGDLKKIQTALELYYADNRQYPNPGTTAYVPITNSTLTSALVSNYISGLPDDPNTTVHYQYRRPTPDTYNIAANLERAESTQKCDPSTAAACPSGFDKCCRFVNP